MRTIASASALLLGLLAAGCTGELVGGGQIPARVVVVSGDMQFATVGTEVPQPLVVRVVDDRNRPVKNQLVNFVVTAGGGSVFAGSAITNAEGEARERWTLGTVAGDTQRVEARAVDPATGQALVFAVFRAVGTAAGAASISAVQPTMSGQPGTPIADSAAALVRDQYGNPVPGVTVNWAVTSGGGSVSPASSTTDAQGIARARWTLGGSVATPQTLRASAGASMSATFSATAALGAGATLAIVSGDGQTGQVTTELPAPLVVEVRQNGVPVQGVPVQWSAADGTLSGAPVTDAQGQASARWTLGTVAATRIAQAVVPGVGFTVGFQANVTPGAPARVFAQSLPPGYAVAAGEVISIRFGVADAYGNRVPGATLSFSSAPGGAVSPATTTTDAEGYGYTSWTLPTTAGTQAVLTASSPGVPETASVQVAVRRGPTVAIRITPDVVTVAPNAEAAFNAYLLDAYGNQERAWINGTECQPRWSTSPPAHIVYGASRFVPDVRIYSSTSTTVTVRCEDSGLSDTAELVVQ